MFGALLCQGPANAGAIVGGSSLLSGGDVTQLETWLGEGPLTLTNIFTKGIDGTTSTDWHNSVDGQGRTFSIIRIVDNLGVEATIGGYNPQSWNSTSGYNITLDDADRTAFIFNLSTGIAHYQCKSTDNSTCGEDDAYANEQGIHQTYNAAHFGPLFGSGNDLRVEGDLNSGWGWATSYGAPAGDVYGGSVSPLDTDPSTHNWQAVTALETFTISEFTAVPTPHSLALFGLGLLGLGYFRRKQAA